MLYGEIGRRLKPALIFQRYRFKGHLPPPRVTGCLNHVACQIKQTDRTKPFWLQSEKHDKSIVQKFADLPQAETIEGKQKAAETISYTATIFCQILGKNWW